MQIVYGSRSDYRTENEKQVADYRIVVCHDAACPGMDKKGHLLDGLDRSHHHDYRFVSDARPEPEVMADVLAMEKSEVADTGPKLLDLSGAKKGP